MAVFETSGRSRLEPVARDRVQAGVAQLPLRGRALVAHHAFEHVARALDDAPARRVLRVGQAFEPARIERGEGKFGDGFDRFGDETLALKSF